VVASGKASAPMPPTSSLSRKRLRKSAARAEAAFRTVSASRTPSSNRRGGNLRVRCASSGPQKAQAMAKADCSVATAATETPSASAIGCSTPEKTKAPVVKAKGQKRRAIRYMPQPAARMKQVVVPVARIRPWLSSTQPEAVAVLRPRLCTSAQQRTWPVFGRTGRMNFTSVPSEA